MTAGPTRHRFRLRLPIVLVLLATVAIEGVYMIASERMMRARTDEQIAAIHDAARAHGQLLRENLTRLVDQIATLHGLARVVTEGCRTGNTAMEAAAMAEVRRWAAVLGRDLFQISGIGADGYVMWSNLQSPERRVYVGDRDHFRRVANGEMKRFVSEELVGRISGRPTIQFVEGIYAAEGAFVGATLISLAPEALLRVPSGLGLGPNDVVVLLRRDGTIIARSKASRGVHAMPLDGAMMRGALASPSNVIRHNSAVDGRDRIAATEWLPDTDLIVGVGLDVQSRLDAAAPLRDRMHWVHRAIMLLIAVVGIGFAVLLHWWRTVSTLRTQARAASQSEALFRQMAEGLPDIVQLLDGQGRTLYVSPRIAELPGIDPAALIGAAGTTIGAYVGATPAMLRGQPQGTSARAEVRLLTPDGRSVWMQTAMRVIAVPNGDRTAARIVAASRDITRQHDDEAALRAAKEELDTALWAARGALLRLRLERDGTVRLLFATDNLVDIIGYEPAEAMALPGGLATLCDPAFAPQTQTFVRSLLSQGSGTIKLRVRRKDGEWIWASVWASRLADQDPLTAVCFATDVTRQHETDLHLAQTTKLAMLGEMSTSIAHELNQPLTVIGVTADGLVAMLQRGGAVPAAMLPRLERIIGQVQRAASIVRHLRVFGRKADGTPGLVSISRVVEGAAAVVAPRLEREGVRLEPTLAPDLPPVQGYLVLLEQVLANLIDNAVHAIATHQPSLPDDRRVVALDARRVGSQIEITVTDRAGGIDPAKLGRVFEPFFTTKPAGEGTGLGLSISYGIISDMGGKIGAANTDDGARFTITLPIPAVAATTADAEVARAK